MTASTGTKGLAEGTVNGGGDENFTFDTSSLLVRGREERVYVHANHGALGLREEMPAGRSDDGFRERGSGDARDQMFRASGLVPRGGKMRVCKGCEQEKVALPLTRPRADVRRDAQDQLGRTWWRGLCPDCARAAKYKLYRGWLERRALRLNLPFPREGIRR